MKTKFWIGILAVVLAGCIGLSAVLLWPREPASRAAVYSEGELLCTLDLYTDTEFSVESKQGTNVVTVRDGKVAVTEADCPDHYCMDRGFQNSGTPIVCLPNALVIEFLDSEEIDMAVG